MTGVVLACSPPLPGSSCFCVETGSLFTAVASLGQLCRPGRPRTCADSPAVSQLPVFTGVSPRLADTVLGTEHRALCTIGKGRMDRFSQTVLPWSPCPPPNFVHTSFCLRSFHPHGVLDCHGHCSLGFDHLESAGTLSFTGLPHIYTRSHSLPPTVASTLPLSCSHGVVSKYNAGRLVVEGHRCPVTQSSRLKAP